jgi:cardiolipin synthase
LCPVRRILFLLLACLPASMACVHRDKPQDLHLRDDLSAPGTDVSLALRQSVGVGLRPGHSVQLLQDEQILQALEEEIRSARESLHLLASPWVEGAASQRLTAALAARQPGVACRILVDPLHSPGFEEHVKPRLAGTGCEVRAFRPFPGAVVTFADERVEARNYRQLLIRDGRVGLTGGAGVGPAWRDTYVRVEGNATRELQQAFAESWHEAGGALLPDSAFPPATASGEARAAFVASTGSPSLSHTERLTQLLIASARGRLWLTNGCFVPSSATLNMLMLKARKGVDVRVLVPGPGHGTNPRALAAQRSLYERLLEAGVRVWEYQPSRLQARTVLVDERLAAVGSMNLELHAHATLEEGALVAEDPRLAHTLAETFEKDLASAVEIRREEWQRRSLFERFNTPLPRSDGGCQ